MNKGSLSIMIIMCVLVSCKVRSTHNNEVQDNGKTLTLIICASGGSRAHIINIDSTNELSYRVGDFISKDDSYTITYDTDYKEIKRHISNLDAQKLMEYSFDENALAYNDSSIVKDSWDYFIG